MKFLFTAGDKASKTAFFATIYTAMVVFSFPWVMLGTLKYPPLTETLLIILWGSYIGSNKAKDWIAAAKNGKNGGK
jgi:hypothetical protein